MVAELVVYRRIISAEESAAARRAVAPWVQVERRKRGFVPPRQGVVNPARTTRKATVSRHGRAGRFSARGCAHTRALTRS